MKVIKKYIPNNFNGFEWLNFDYLPESEGGKFEIYFNASEDLVSHSIIIFYSLFKDFLENTLIKTFGRDNNWGDFCLDTWDIENEMYDYSPENKEEPTASYLAMLKDSEIEPTYTGFCECVDWKKFLHVMFHCVMQHKAPYSIVFYGLNDEFIFYFHHSGSFGVYYKELNEGIKSIIKKVKKEGLEIKNTNDKRVVSMII